METSEYSIGKVSVGVTTPIEHQQTFWIVNFSDNPAANLLEKGAVFDNKWVLTDYFFLLFLKPPLKKTYTVTENWKPFCWKQGDWFAIFYFGLLSFSPNWHTLPEAKKIIHAKLSIILICVFCMCACVCVFVNSEISGTGGRSTTLLTPMSRASPGELQRTTASWVDMVHGSRKKAFRSSSLLTLETTPFTLQRC